MSGGSDWPIVDADPLAAMEAAVTRAAGWDPAQRLSAAEALTAYTTGAAHAARLNGAVGLLWRGAFADFAVLDASPEDVGRAAEGVRRPRVVSTFVGGRCAYGCDVA